jgi:hypothetical protein
MDALCAKRLVLGVKFGVLTAQVASFGDSRFITDDLSFKFVCPSLLVSGVRFERLIQLAHLLCGPSGKLFAQAFEFVSLTVQCSQDFSGVFATELLFQLLKRTDKPALNVQSFTQSSIFRL